MPIFGEGFEAREPEARLLRQRAEQQTTDFLERSSSILDRVWTGPHQRISCVSRTKRAPLSGRVQNSGLDPGEQRNIGVMVGMKKTAGEDTDLCTAVFRSGFVSASSLFGSE